ncbi:tyrosine-type recombinase/integrase [Hymenobacter sp. YC55]|uniref:tyrosine-type recombinase/integrase n=1 Tax=Hymenobacter sp. YC55 TaxID=3034019 RepID=UPI0023F8CE9F|nr:tyrosine-type recombinase/integrase [Hymenobacter sp. YC55]MDF7812862.1 tyrosine-type recombinase/integrase [Hymenobacter sp. YC55]
MSYTSRKTETAPLAWGEFETLIAKLVTDIQVRRKKNRARMLMGAALGTFCGLRAGDVLKLRWQDLVGRATLVLQEQKTGKQRNITLNPRLQELVGFAYEAVGKPEGQSYIMSNGRSEGKKPISIQFWNREISQILHEYGIHTLNPSSHTFRKTFGRRVFELNNRSEEALIVLSQIFGHTSISISRRYIGIQQERIADIYLSI